MQSSQLDLERMGIRLRQKRKAKGLRQKELAKLVELSETHISNLERGRYLPSLPCLLRLCDVLGETPDYYLFGLLPRPYASTPASMDERETAEHGVQTAKITEH